LSKKEEKKEIRIAKKYQFLKETPWDRKVFGINTFEIIAESEETLLVTINEIKKNKIKGHYTIKVDPLWNSRILSNYGFYYCDTLIQPYCNYQNFINYDHEKICLSTDNSLEQLLSICNGAFIHGRFHRDYNFDKKQADMRYNSWLTDLFNQKKVWSLIYENKLAGFWGFSQQNILLHALKTNYRGKRMAKYFWSKACQGMFKLGHKEIISSISASNLAVLNLYVSLGFKFKNPQDVYHLLIN
jgi:L-amino acid N-acyltransferase YncA